MNLYIRKIFVFRRKFMKLITPAEEQKVIKCFAKTRGVYSMGPVVYPSGRRGPFNIDFVKVYCQPENLKIIGKLLAKTIKQIPDIELICGIVAAGIPLAVAASIYSGLPYVYVRPEKHERTGEIIQGTYKKGQRAILLDDVVGRGGTKDKVLQLIGNKLIIKDLLVVLHPGFARGYLQDLEIWQNRTHINLYWLTDWLTITQAAVEAGTLAKEPGEIMIEYLKDADDWQANEAKFRKFLSYKEKSGLEFGEPIV